MVCRFVSPAAQVSDQRTAGRIAPTRPRSGTQGRTPAAGRPAPHPAGDMLEEVAHAVYPPPPVIGGAMD